MGPQNVAKLFFWIHGSSTAKASNLNNACQVLNSNNDDTNISEHQ